MKYKRHDIRATLRNGRIDWYRIENKAGEATVYIYDEIGYFGVTASDFVKELNDIDAETINLHINSPGGDYFDGVAILNCLRNHKANIIATVDGLAASAASFIAMAGNEIVMAKNSEMMIHDAIGLCVGNAADMQDLAERLDVLSDNVASIYADRAGGSKESWREKMQEESWYSADEAVEAGLADRVAGSEEKTDDQTKNKFDLSFFNYEGRKQAPPPTPVFKWDAAEFTKLLKEAIA